MIGGKRSMIFLSNLQKETLFLVDKLVGENKTHGEIENELLKNGYEFIKEIKNGYMSKTKTSLYKRDENGKLENSFVDLIKRKNGLASWETWRIS